MTFNFSCYFNTIIDDEIFRERQILYAEPIVKQNKRERIPVTGESKDPSNPLNSIFPFDEYILKRYLDLSKYLNLKKC